MPDGAPALIAIEPDDYHAEYVGRTSDGKQFFLTTPFEPAIAGAPGCEFIALYIFDADGLLINNRIESLGPRATMNDQVRQSVREKWLRDLGTIALGRIEIQPFAIERFGMIFGLVAKEPEEGDSWTVEAQPGNYMSFFEPWDSGEYDT